MNIILGGEKRHENGWSNLRTACIAGYHNEDKQAKFLFYAHLINKLESKPNNLYVLQHGNAPIELVNPWPLPSHPDEQPIDPDILTFLYGKQYRTEGDKVIWTKALAGWDTLYELKNEQEVNICPGKENTSADAPNISQIFPAESGKEAPFSVYKIGPFTQQGPVLVSFAITLDGEAYNESIDRNGLIFFKSPERILSRLDYGDIPLSDYRKDSNCLTELQRFRKPLSFGEGYDIIFLTNPGVDSLKKRTSTCTNKATLQPPNGSAIRYIADDYSIFELVMQLSKKKATKNIESLV